MPQRLDHDEVRRVIAAPPDRLYPLVADPARMPELSPNVTRVIMLDGAREAAVGVRFRARNTSDRGGRWWNRPVFTVVDPGREIAWERTEPLLGTLEWRYRFEPVPGGTEVIESYTVTRPITAFGWFVLERLVGHRDLAGSLRRGMVTTLERMAEVATRGGATPVR